MRQSLLTGFIIALALKGLVDPDCLIFPAPSVPGVAVRLHTTSNSARTRLDSLESQLVLVQAAVASFEVNSEARSVLPVPRLLTLLSCIPQVLTTPSRRMSLASTRTVWPPPSLLHLVPPHTPPSSIGSGRNTPVIPTRARPGPCSSPSWSKATAAPLPRRRPRYYDVRTVRWVAQFLRAAPRGG